MISWPQRIAEHGTIRHQFQPTSIDVVPTILEAAWRPDRTVATGRPAPDRGRQHGLHLRRRECEGASTRVARSTSRCSVSRHLPRRLVAATLHFRRTRPGTARRQLPTDVILRTGSSTTSRRTRPNAEPRRASTPGRSRNLQSLFWVEATRAGCLPIGALRRSIALLVQRPGSRLAGRTRSPTRGTVTAETALQGRLRTSSTSRTPHGGHRRARRRREGVLPRRAAASAATASTC